MKSFKNITQQNECIKKLLNHKSRVYFILFLHLHFDWKAYLTDIQRLLSIDYNKNKI